MNITCNITDGMKPHEKDAYFKHMEMRHRQESELIQKRKEEMMSYKQMLICDIIKFSHGRFAEDDLKRKTTRDLERIYDYC